MNRGLTVLLNNAHFEFYLCASFASRSSSPKPSFYWSLKTLLTLANVIGGMPGHFFKVMYPLSPKISQTTFQKIQNSIPKTDVADVMHCNQIIDNETKRLLSTVCKATPKPDASTFIYRKYTTRITLPPCIQ